MGYSQKPGVTGNVAAGGQYDNLTTVDSVSYQNLGAEKAAASQLSADASALSAAASSSSASNALVSATGTAANAATASAGATTATTQAGIATTGANTATTQAGIATTQASNTSVSASTATTQATNASNSAAAASSSASDATTQATNAANSASAISGSASSASTSASNAASSAASINKDGSGGVPGLTLFKINMRNILNTLTSFFTNSNTTSRTYTLPDKDGTVAMVSDITGTNSGTNTGDQTISLTGGVTGSGNGSFAATVITNANLTGVVTSTGNATAVADAALTIAKTSGLQSALDLKQSLLAKDVASGYAGLDASGKINPSQLPALAITDTFVVASQAAQTALTAEVGDLAVRTDLNKSFILQVTGASTFSNWQELLTPTDSVASVFGRTGVVTAQSNDYTAAQVGAPSGSGSSTGNNTGDQTNVSGTSANVTGIVAIANGGTNSTTAETALVSLGNRSSATGSEIIPTGTTGQRDGSPQAGFFRFNTTNVQFEGYTGASWSGVGGASGGGGNPIVYENDSVVTASYAITAGKNASSTGPLTINSGAAVTVPTGSRWIIS